MKTLTVFTTQVVSTNVEKWRTELSPNDRVLFTAVAGDLLEALGYDAPDPVRRVSPLERLVWGGHNALVGTIRRLRTALDPAFARTSWEFVRVRLFNMRAGIRAK